MVYWKAFSSIPTVFVHTFYAENIMFWNLLKIKHPLLPISEKSRIVWVLFIEFFKIATYVVGGGFAILIVAEDTFVKKYKWLREGELSDMLALIQTVPGLTAGNIAIYTGYRLAGFTGALAALTGVALPSFIVITVIAAGFAFLPLENPIVQGAFNGVRTAMAGLMIVAMIRIWKKSVRDFLQYLVFFVTAALILLFHWNPGWFIGGAILLGPIWCLLILRKMPQAALDEDTSGSPENQERAADSSGKDQKKDSGISLDNQKTLNKTDTQKKKEIEK